MFLLVYKVEEKRMFSQAKVYQLLFYLLFLATLTVHTKDNLRFDV